MTIRGLTVIISKSNICIKNSFRVTDDEEKIKVIKEIFKRCPEIKEHRTWKNMLSEWKAHNILFQHKIKRNSTKDTDFEFKQKFIYKFGYWFISHLFKEKCII